MIERLHRALEHIEELSPEVQEDLARQIEDMAALPPQESLQAKPDEGLLPSVQRALELGGAWNDLHADEFAFFESIRRESKPTPPMADQLAWLDEDDK